MIPSTYAKQPPQSPVARDVRNVLNLPPSDIGTALAQSGAMNTKPPIVHSSHLINKNTGLILPWNTLLAEQRDIMLPCDETGNTDPAAWRSTVVEQDEEAENVRLYWEARKAISEQAGQMTSGYENDMTKCEIPTGENDKISGVMSLDAYYGQIDDPYAEQAQPPSASETNMLNDVFGGF